MPYYGLKNVSKLAGLIKTEIVFRIVPGGSLNKALASTLYTARKEVESFTSALKRWSVRKFNGIRILGINVKSLWAPKEHHKTSLSD